ncbi:Pr6Pr family membrane protein [Pontivivens ytuae]|uniref:Pr6Pr family membrane protein n=1 Tax=Pontivivens ytuae TaxID=2789856 RepID=A0A7S9LTP9_9RHOB|nr:Pr6Pr family membrane protein [Pontivivens ytuae]QPH55047.1 Pr6Pr family membrane protein [Pontivivens ytuae]
MRAETIVALLAWSAVIANTALRISRGEGPGEAIWTQARYFTFLTNTTVALIFTHAALTGRGPGASLAGAATVWISVVGLVYHALLNQGFVPSQPDFWTDHMLHTVVPLTVFGYWALRAEKAGLGLRDAVIWAGFPMAYLVYALGRGLIDGRFPYYFIDPSDIGWAGVAIWVTGLTTLFVGLGWALTLAGRTRVLSRT